MIVGDLPFHCNEQVNRRKVRKSQLEQVAPVVGPDGIILNGPMKACECSGSLFFGENKIACYREVVTHDAGDMVVFCIWDDLIQISNVRDIRLTVASSYNESLIFQHAPIEGGIADILTHVHIQDRVAVVATTLDVSWFPRKGFIDDFQVVVQGKGIFGIYEPHVETREAPGRYVRSSTSHSKNESIDIVRSYL